MEKINVVIPNTRKTNLRVHGTEKINLHLRGGGSGTGNYNALTNKPSINEVELIGDKSFDDLGDHTLSNIEIKTIFDRVFRGE